MQRLRITLLADGPSDRALIPILRWLLRRQCGSIPIQSRFADLRFLPRPSRELSQRIRQSVELFPCDLLFVHRDAERESIGKRVEEIREALGKSGLASPPTIVCVVPVRMQEAWLLIDETALRKAAGNPNGSQPLNMPKVNELEKLPDPKRSLHDLIRESSGLQGRRLDRLQSKLSTCVQRVADLIEDFQPLRGLSAFQHLEVELAQLVKDQGWDSSAAKGAGDGG